MPESARPGSGLPPPGGGIRRTGRELPAALLRHRSEIEAELRSLVDEASGEQTAGASLLYDMMRYHFGWMDEGGHPSAVDGVGKAIRPALCLLAHQTCGGDHRRAMPVAAAIELIHNYSLIHDDIQDDDRERRHRPTVWSIWGKAQAINAGTAVRMLACAAVRRLDFPVPLRERIQASFDDATTRIVEGQCLDIAAETNIDIRCGDYLTMIGAKTAALIKRSLEAGAILATGDESVISAFGDLGWNLGLAFQIRDDILGIWGREEDTGKIAGGDIVRRKKTLPVVLALDKAEGALRGELLKAFDPGVPDVEAVKAVTGVLEQLGVRGESERLSSRFTTLASRIIEQLPIEAQAKLEFGEIVRFLEGRTF